MYILLFILIAAAVNLPKCVAECPQVYTGTPTFMDCGYRCHCRNDTQCDPQTGHCENGCKFGWMGPGCQYRNIAINRTAFGNIGSTVIAADYADKAIDGNIETCSKTDPKRQPGNQWWRIAWGRNYLLKGLVLKLHSDDLDDFRNFRVETGTGHTNSEFTTLCYQHTNSPAVEEMEIMCQQPSRTQHLRVILATPDVPLRLCEVEIYGGRQTSFNMVTDQPSTYGSFQSFHSVDGHDLSQYSGNDLETATEDACSATGPSENNPWWYVNFGRKFEIQDVYFYGRRTHKEQFQGYIISVGNSSEATTEIYRDDEIGTAIDAYQPKMTQLRNTYIGQFIQVKRELNSDILTICEVLVFADCPINECGWNCSLPCYCQGDVTGNMKIEGSCPNGCLSGWTGNNGKCDIGCWGDSCENTCGQCSQQPCNQVTGECPEGCVGPWKPPLCVVGCWGNGCENECGNCFEQPCDTVNAECSDGCNGPWYPPLCVEACDNFTYGINCSNNCGNCRNGSKCNIDTGVCPYGCDDGWNLDDCTVVCKIGTYGYNCSETCGKCYDTFGCDHVNGHCEHGCEAGYKEKLCKEECANGTYGLNCSENCGHCFEEQFCDHVTGYCSDGCAAGYIGHFCNDECTNGTYGINCTSVCGFCWSNSSCNNVNGSCGNGCQDGWRGNLCVEVCENGTYGSNCSNDCGNCLGSAVCDHVTGYCEEGCEAGYIGHRCLDECENGTYGYNCSRKCGNCLGSNICDHVTGYCRDSCKPGYLGIMCIDVCTNGTYGVNCTNDCGNCLNNATCDHENGICETGCQDGWKGDICVKECENGTYGYNCSRKCGNCLGSNTCDHVTGYCRDSCKPGYLGIMCIDVCAKGTYGVNCTNDCGNCLNNATCDHENGICETGCQDGWKGDICVEECENGTYGYNCSGKCGNCLGSNTCDHVTGYCRDSCKPGYLGFMCIDVCGNGTYGVNCTNDCGNCLNNATCDHENGICETGCQDGWKGDICVEECENGTYGYNCSGKCGNCLGLNTCDHVTGYCRDSCKPGYLGIMCKDVCANGTYGVNCTNDCGNCLNNATCDHENGICETGCQDGWKGDICVEECENMTYGENCSGKCGNCQGLLTCNHITGQCNNGCEPGYIGIKCSDECDDGQYGRNCLESCGQCLEISDCNKNNGYCLTGCAAGWNGSLCDKHCDTGTYGIGCLNICGNCRATHCTQTTGACPFGCSHGFEGDLCISKVSDPPRGQPIAAISGSIVGVIIAIVIGIAAIFIYKRRQNRQSKKKDSIEGNTFSNPQAVWTRESTQNETSQRVTISKTNAQENTSARNQDSVWNNQNNRSAIPVSQLRSVCSTAQRDPSTLYSEFKTLPYGLQYDASVAKNRQHITKNRYKDMYPYNSNRVILPEIPGDEEGSTYINASHINGYNTPGKYIAAQGAIEATVNDIWRMVWSEGITVIVMLTKCYELGRMKCFQYWSDEGSFEYGDITTDITSVEKYTDFEIRTFVCFKTDSRERRTVLQFHYTAWPDKDVPDNALTLVQFWHTVRKNDIAKKTPWLIHCSAGVGRTGTFIALDYLYDQGVSEGKVGIKDVVYTLREQRLNMVQMKEQYVYLHEVVAEVLDPIGTVCKTDEFNTVCEKLIANRRTDVETLFDEYKKICENTDTDNKSEEDVVYGNITNRPLVDAQRTENVHKSRNLDIVPADIHRPRLCMAVEGGNDFINSVFVPTFRRRDRMILTQLPLKDTVVDFIRMVWDFDVKIFVLLEEDVPENEKYWPTQRTIKSFGPFKAELIDGANEDVYILRTIRYSCDGKTEQKVVRQFHFTAWPNDSVTPVNTEAVLNLFSNIVTISQDSDCPLVIQCLDGAMKSGLLCVLWCVLERMKTDSDVAIAETVRLVRLRRKQVIDNFDQYQFCYRTIRDYLDSHNIYANVL